MEVDNGLLDCRPADRVVHSSRAVSHGRSLDGKATRGAGWPDPQGDSCRRGGAGIRPGSRRGPVSIPAGAAEPPIKRFGEPMTELKLDH